MTVYSMGKPVRSSAAAQTLNASPSTGHLRPEVADALPSALLSQIMAYAMNSAFQSMDEGIAQNYEDAEPVHLEDFVEDFLKEFSELVNVRCGLSSFATAYLNDRQSAARLFVPIDPQKAKGQHLPNAGLSVHNPIYKESNHGMLSF